MMTEYLHLHIPAFLIGLLLDLIIGDPRWLPHPVRLMGRLIAAMDRGMNRETGARMGDLAKTKRARFMAGVFLCVTIPALSVLVTALILIGAYRIHVIAGVLTEACLTCYVLAARDLHDESMRVYKAVISGDLTAARNALSMIVGRDTQKLDQEGVLKAAVETVAENTSDGVIAPLLYTVFGGPVLGIFYKSVNTMDSMVGYHNDRYEDYGRAAARLDDLVNLLPSRISAMLIVLSSAIFSLGSPVYRPTTAFRIWGRDARKHASPNSAQTESACAGALGIELGGEAFYGGLPVFHPLIGDRTREVEPQDIRRACHLMFLSETLAAVAGVGICLAIHCLVKGVG